MIATEKRERKEINRDRVSGEYIKYPVIYERQEVIEDIYNSTTLTWLGLYTSAVDTCTKRSILCFKASWAITAATLVIPSA